MSITTDQDESIHYLEMSQQFPLPEILPIRTYKNKQINKTKQNKAACSPARGYRIKNKTLAEGTIVTTHLIKTTPDSFCF